MCVFVNVGLCVYGCVYACLHVPVRVFVCVINSPKTSQHVYTCMYLSQTILSMNNSEEVVLKHTVLHCSVVRTVMMD